MLKQKNVKNNLKVLFLLKSVQHPRWERIYFSFNLRSKILDIMIAYIVLKGFERYIAVKKTRK